MVQYVKFCVVNPFLYCIDYFFFFFQAEDGIRDLTVTGVQTCALPILLIAEAVVKFRWGLLPTNYCLLPTAFYSGAAGIRTPAIGIFLPKARVHRLEIGRASCRESVDLGGRRIIKKKKNKTKL